MYGKIIRRMQNKLNGVIDVLWSLLLLSWKRLYVNRSIGYKILPYNNEAIGILTQIENKNVCCVYLIKIRP